MNPPNRILKAAVALALAFGCSKSPEVLQFDRNVDKRIQTELDQRLTLVQGNPVHVELVQKLKDGRSKILSGRPREALLTFDSILEDQRFLNFPEYWYAKYFLAVALYDVGVRYGSLLYFVDIVDKEPLRIHTHESLRRAIAIAQELKDDELILFLASTIASDKVPRSLRDEFRFFVAKHHYRSGDFGRAIDLFKSIPHTNRLYLGARYIMGTIEVERKKWKAAIEHFQSALDARTPVKYYEDHTIRQLSALALGRVFYEQKNFPLSIVYYKKVEPDTEYYPAALYEASWALFKLNKFNEALSVLHSLQSPFFEQVYFLKSYLLKGAIFLELCLYEDSVATLTALETEFRDLKTQIDRFAGMARSPRDYYSILSSRSSTEDGRTDYNYRHLFNLASANRDFLGVHHYLLNLRQEQEILRSVGGNRATLLGRLMNQKISDLTDKASYLAGQKLRVTRQVIDDFEGLRDFVRYEIVSAERKILQSRSIGLAPPVISGQDLIRPEFTESLKETMMWWDWSGEYWKDEIGYYLVNLKSRCLAAGEPK